MRNLTMGIGVLMFAPVAALASDNAHLSAGRWHEQIRTTSATLDGKPVALAPFDGSRETCMTAKQAADPTVYFMRGGGKECTAKGAASAGKISFSGECLSGGRPMTYSMEGQYKATGYKIDATANTEVDGKSLVTTQIIEGRYVGACTALMDASGRTVPRKLG